MLQVTDIELIKMAENQVAPKLTIILDCNEMERIGKQYGDGGVAMAIGLHIVEVFTQYLEEANALAKKEKEIICNKID